MTDELNRYSCQVVLPGFGATAQKRLARAKVLVVGMGGLGCPAAQYLAAAGIGSLVLADHDKISLPNLHRQILYAPGDVGAYKSEVAASVLSRQNPDIQIIAHKTKITASNAQEVVDGCDIVVDCTDNFGAHYALNDACVTRRVPLVYGAAYQQEGQIAVWNVRNPDGSYSPNYRDLFPAPDFTAAADCSSGGVMPTLTGVIGCMQANEALAYLTSVGGLLASQLLIFDSSSLRSYIVDLPSATSCGSEFLPVETNADQLEISTDELRRMMTQGTCELVDVRSQSEHRDYNIGGSLVPLDQIAQGHLDIDVERPVVFYCLSGARSAAAVHHARRLHPDGRFYSLEGGLQAWRRAMPDNLSVKKV